MWIKTIKTVNVTGDFLGANVLSAKIHHTQAQVSLIYFILSHIYENEFIYMKIKTIIPRK